MTTAKQERLAWVAGAYLLRSGDWVEWGVLVGAMHSASGLPVPECADVLLDAKTRGHVEIRGPRARVTVTGRLQSDELRGPIELVSPADDELWRAQCAGKDGDLNAFFPRQSSKKARAASKAICSDCTVRDQCLSWALRTEEPHGTAGGLDEWERREILRHRGVYLADEIDDEDHEDGVSPSDQGGPPAALPADLGGASRSDAGATAAPSTRLPSVVATLLGPLADMVCGPGRYSASTRLPRPLLPHPGPTSAA